MTSVLITGASGGIGGALCRYFEAAGCTILAHARNEANARKAVEGTDWTPVWCDVTRDEEIAGLAKQVSSAGGVDHVVHNAGLLSKTTEKGPHGVGMQAEVNVLAPYLISKALMPLLKKSEQPRITTISSTATMFAPRPAYGSLADPNGTSLFGHYAQSKSAANALTLKMAGLWPQVHVASTEPGFVKTKMTAGNSSMPWLMGKMANVIGTTPEQAARRCFDALEANDYPSGVIVQGGKPVASAAAKWGSEAARRELQALFDKAGIKL